MKNFFSTSLKSIGQTGTVKPSSRHLINDMLKNIDFREGQTFVEFGPGDGCITDALLKRMSAGSKLISFELNDEFYHYSSRKFAGDKRVAVHKDTALNFDQPEYMKDEDSVDYVVSSLPLTLLKGSEVEALLQKVKMRLKPDGRYIQYQYSLGKLGHLKRVFRDVSLKYTMLNVPPAFVYTCKK